VENEEHPKPTIETEDGESPSPRKRVRFGIGFVGEGGGDVLIAAKRARDYPTE